MGGDDDGGGVWSRGDAGDGGELNPPHQQGTALGLTTSGVYDTRHLLMLVAALTKLRL